MVNVDLDALVNESTTRAATKRTVELSLDLGAFRRQIRTCKVRHTNEIE